MDQRSYGFWLTQIMTEAHRLTKTGGTALLFTDWRQLPTTTDAIQAAGWLWRGVLAWQSTMSTLVTIWRRRSSLDTERA